jgi:putative salt-induced outer membrane protein YdiY
MEILNARYDMTKITALAVGAVLMLSAAVNADDEVVWSDTPAHERAAKSKPAASEMVVVEDTSGLSEAEVLEQVNQAEEQQKQVDINEVISVMDSNGTVDLEKITGKWEDLSPKADKADWVQSTSGEWFRGEFKALYDEELEFESDEVGDYTFSIGDVAQFKSHRMISVNIEDEITFSGIVRLDRKEIVIIQGDKRYTFPRSKVVSAAPTSAQERDNWSGKITLSFDKRTGNKDMSDLTIKANVKRRTDKTHLKLDYLGRISEQDGQKTADDMRINERFNVYLTRYFFWTPIFSEYYKDQFQNIRHQVTAGTGLGYTIIKTPKVEWDVSGGPGFIYTEYETVEAGEDKQKTSPALQLNTRYEWELTSKNDVTFDATLTYTDKDAGTYKHHLVFSLENEITKWLDLDLTAIWDHITDPQEASDGTVPEQDDYQFLVGLGVEF